MDGNWNKRLIDWEYYQYLLSIRGQRFANRYKGEEGVLELVGTRRIKKEYEKVIRTFWRRYLHWALNSIKRKEEDMNEKEWLKKLDEEDTIQWKKGARIKRTVELTGADRKNMPSPASDLVYFSALADWQLWQYLNKENGHLFAHKFAGMEGAFLLLNSKNDLNNRQIEVVSGFWKRYQSLFQKHAKEQ